MARVRPDQASLIASFREQIEFLESSVFMFDEGKISEAKRMALTLRVLFRHFGGSHALLEQLEILSSIRLLDTAFLDGKWTRTAHFQFALEFEGEDGETWFSPSGMDGLVGVADVGGIPTYVAPLHAGRQNARWLRFDPWWKGAVMDFPGGERLSRWDLVNIMTNQDGGGHVDPRGVDVAYDEFRTKGYGASWLHEAAAGGLGIGPNYYAGNAAAASMRQIAYEVLATFSEDRQVQGLVGSPLAGQN